MVPFNSQGGFKSLKIKHNFPQAFLDKHQFFKPISTLT